MDGKRVLLVDDDPATITFAIISLKQAGYQTDFAYDGIGAWELLKKSPDKYDLIIADQIMPQMNGLELLARIKSSAKLCNIPVIIETAFNNQEIYLQALDKGAYDFIYKPFSRDLLLYVIDNAINNDLKP